MALLDFIFGKSNYECPLSLDEFFQKTYLLKEEYLININDTSGWEGEYYSYCASIEFQVGLLNFSSLASGLNYTISKLNAIQRIKKSADKIKRKKGFDYKLELISGIVDEERSNPLKLKLIFLDIGLSLTDTNKLGGLSIIKD